MKTKSKLCPNPIYTLCLCTEVGKVNVHRFVASSIQTAGDIYG